MSGEMEGGYREVSWAEVERRWPEHALNLTKCYGYDLDGFRFVTSPDGWLFVQSMRIGP